MSELEIDNPAQRLPNILTAGKSNARHYNCRQVWQKILVAPDNHEQVRSNRLGK